MYKLVFSASFRKDIVDITYYISYILKNQSAASNLAKKIQNSLANILIFPYDSPVSLKLIREKL